MDLLPNEQNFNLDKSRQKFHHSLKEHHKIESNITIKFFVGLHGDKTYNTFCLWKQKVLY